MLAMRLLCGCYAGSMLFSSIGIYWDNTGFRWVHMGSDGLHLVALSCIWLLCACFAVAMCLLCACSVVAMRLLCDFYVVAMQLLCGCYLVSIWLLCGCYAVAMWFLCGCYAVAVRLL